MLGCTHPSRIGDNHGETCMVCGEKLSGYGHFARQGAPCLHQWISCGPGGGEGEGYEICLYCEQMRPREEGE